MNMNKRIVYIVLFQLYCCFVFSESISGRIVTPYLNVIGYYDYVAKCNVINYTRTVSFPHTLAALQIIIIDTLNKDLPDTLWVKSFYKEFANVNIDVENIFSNQYYIAIKKNERGFFTDFGSPYCMLKIENDRVFTTFTKSDVFFSHLLRLGRYRKMKIEKFEERIVRKMPELKIRYEKFLVEHGS